MSEEIAEQIADTLGQILKELREMNARERSASEVYERQRQAIEDLNKSDSRTIDGGTF
ncbi:MAG TPA: hypothetical protein VGB70_05975 [Allosphingosinicella sp.]|jgi:hypothetical protein